MTDRKSRTFLLRAILLIVIPMIAVSIGIYFYLIGGRYITTDNAYVKADIVQISADVQGRVTNVAVRDHQTVQKGELLFRIDSAPIEIAVSRAEAEMGMVFTEVETMRAEYEEAKSRLGEIDARIAFLERQMARQQKLRKRGITTSDALDRAASDLAIERQKKLVAQQTMRRLLTALGGDPQMDARTHPIFLEKATMLRDAKLDLSRSAVYAPTSGVITNMKLQVSLTPIPTGRSRPPSKASRLPPAPNSQCCRPRTPQATGSKSCSDCRSNCAWSIRTKTRHRCAPA